MLRSELTISRKTCDAHLLISSEMPVWDFPPSSGTDLMHSLRPKITGLVWAAISRSIIERMRPLWPLALLGAGNVSVHLAAANGSRPYVDLPSCSDVVANLLSEKHPTCRPILEMAIL